MTPNNKPVPARPGPSRTGLGEPVPVPSPLRGRDGLQRPNTKNLNTKNGTD